MYSCIICHFDAELDDVAVLGGARSCVCLRCYSRETNSDRPMPRRLRQDLISTLAGIGVA